MKRRIKVVLKREAPKKPPVDPVRQRHLDDVRTLNMRVTLAVEDVMRDGSIEELGALVYLLQGLETLIYYGEDLQRNRRKVKK